MAAIRLKAYEYDLALTARQEAERKAAKEAKKLQQASASGAAGSARVEAKAKPPAEEKQKDWLEEHPPKMETIYKVLIELKVRARVHTCVAG